MADEKNVPTVVENLQVLATPEGFQKYLLGTKKNGQPRAIYDVVKDYTKPKKSKKKKKKSKDNDYDKMTSYDIYMKAGKSKKKKKKKKSKKNYWHI